jgi:hypothetical protein
MAQRADFWMGLIAGTLAGMLIAAYSEWDLKVEKEILQELKGASGASHPAREVSLQSEDDEASRDFDLHFGTNG